MRPPTYVEGALVHGVSAHVLARILAGSNVAAALNSLPSWMRPEIDATCRAIRRAARAYEALPPAGGGRAEAVAVDVGPPLPHEITTREAGALLGLGERRMRQLAAAGMGRRTGSRWLLDRSAVLAYAERRRATRGDL